MEKLFFFIKYKYRFYYQMINTLKSSLSKNLENINREKTNFISWFDCILLSLKCNEQCMGQRKTACILLYKSKKKSRKYIEQSNAFVMNIKLSLI